MPLKPLKSLSDRHREFALRFIATGKAKDSYIAAGFSPGGAKQSAHQLLNDPLMRVHVAQLREEKFKALHMDVDEILARTAMLARVNVATLYDDKGQLRPVHDLDEEHAVAIAGIEVQEIIEGAGDSARVIGTIKKVRLRDPLPALRLLAEHKKLVRNTDEGVNALASAIADRLKAKREQRRAKEK